MRKLASVQTILSLEPISGADKIEVATILGWKTVVEKNKFTIGSKVVYFEIDSILPYTDWSLFLDKKNNKKLRIKTIKLKGQISQGIALPISILPPGEYEEGTDVSDILGVTKYDPPENSSNSKRGFVIGKRKSTFPTHLVHKTDETRIQSSPKLLNEFEGKLVYITTKIDGTSSTYMRYNDEYHVCSRNMSISEPTEEDPVSVYWKISYKYNAKEILFREKINYCIQAEVAGPGIQGNKLGLSEPEMFVFNIYDVDNKRYFNFDEFIAFCSKYNLQTVPIESTNLLFSGFSINDLVDMSNGVYQPSGHRREGIVIRPMVETYSPYLGGRLSTKVINPYYLLETDS